MLEKSRTTGVANEEGVAGPLEESDSELSAFLSLFWEMGMGDESWDGGKALKSLL